MAANRTEEKGRGGVSGISGPLEPAEEKRIIEAVQNGDKQAFGKLVRAYQKRLFRSIYSMTRNFDLSEDIVQEAFVKAFGAIDSFRTDMAFYPWLSTIARNGALTHLARMEKQESLDTLQESGREPVSPDDGPFERLLTEEAQKRLYAAVMALPTQFRTVFVCRHLEDMSYTEIANYLKIPPGTVDSRLHRARQILLEQLKDFL